MMHTAHELHSVRAANTPSDESALADTNPECDWCGRAVSRETAFPRVQRGGDGMEVVLLCAGCELGSD